MKKKISIAILIVITMVMFGITINFNLNSVLIKVAGMETEKEKIWKKPEKKKDLCISGASFSLF